MTLRENLENNPVLVVLGALLTGFLAGIAAYRTVLEIQNSEAHPRSAILLRSDVQCYVDLAGVTRQVSGPCPTLRESRKTEADLSEGIRSFFRSQSWLSSDPGSVMGKAKGIVRRFETESDVFSSVEDQIEQHKKNDANWTYANELSEAVALVNALGLSATTPEKNAVFQAMVLPAVKPTELPRETATSEQ